MSHAVFIDDAHGDLIDLRIYCSDFCAQSDDNYAGWNGCLEFDYPTQCEACSAAIYSTNE
jgi:hypothetical protein